MIGLLLNHNPNEMISYRQANDTIIKVVMSENEVKATHFIKGAGPYEGLPAAI